MFWLNYFKECESYEKNEENVGGAAGNDNDP